MQNEALRLKMLGNSYGQVSKALDVPKTTVFRWLNKQPGAPTSNMSMPASPTGGPQSCIFTKRPRTFTPPAAPSYVPVEVPLPIVQVVPILARPAENTPEPAGQTQPRPLDPFQVMDTAMTLGWNRFLQQKVGVPILNAMNPAQPANQTLNPAQAQSEHSTQDQSESSALQELKRKLVQLEEGRKRLEEFRLVEEERKRTAEAERKRAEEKAEAEKKSKIEQQERDWKEYIRLMSERDRKADNDLWDRIRKNYREYDENLKKFTLTYAENLMKGFEQQVASAAETERVRFNGAMEALRSMRELLNPPPPLKPEQLTRSSTSKLPPGFQLYQMVRAEVREDLKIKAEARRKRLRNEVIVGAIVGGLYLVKPLVESYVENYTQQKARRLIVP